MIGNKKFYAAVIDGYTYSQVTDYRYKNFVDFAINYCCSEWILDELKLYHENNPQDFCIDWQSFFEDYYGYNIYYISIDENNNELEDMEDNNTTLYNYCKENNIF